MEGGRKIIREEPSASRMATKSKVRPAKCQNLHQNTRVIGSTCRDREGDEENEGGSRSMPFFEFFGEVPRGGQKKTCYTKLVKASQTPMLPNKEINHVFVCKDLSIFDFGRSQLQKIARKSSTTSCLQRGSRRREYM